MEWLIAIVIFIVIRAIFSKSNSNEQIEHKFEMRLQPDQVVGEHHTFKVFRVQIKGPFPIEQTTSLATATSLHDITDMGSDGKPELMPVLCFLDQFQEKDSLCYFDSAQIGKVAPGHGFTDWQTVATIIPETLTCPRRGQRRLRAFVTCFDSLNPPEFLYGFVTGDALGTLAGDLVLSMENVGYREASEARERTEELTIRAAMAVALSDGSLGTPEGQVMQRWLARKVQVTAEDSREARRTRLNAAMKQAFVDGRQSKLDFGELLIQLNQSADPAGKLDAVELCLDVMSADGQADRNELQTIQRMATTLDVELQRFQEMKDKRIAGLTTSIGSSHDYYALLSIERTWSKEEIRGHLNKLYSQWNARAETFSDPEKRTQAEKMLETIAEARKAILG